MPTALSQVTQGSQPHASLPAHTALRPAFLSLIHRGTFGYTPEVAADLRARGPEGWIDSQLDPQSIDDSALDARLAVFDWLDLSAAQMDNLVLPEWEVAHEARAARLLRATYSKRQLFERIVEFWTDHFNIYGSGDDTWLLKIVDDRDVIRTHALGKFVDLLQASARSPAMIGYLDNDSNVAGAAQENYAREVMELHTLGVDGPYTETDVRELARCFTGWSYYRRWETGPYGEYVFRSGNHDTDAKTVLGISVPAGGGESDATMILDVLAAHASTIDFVTTKLAKWLLGYDPPQSTIDRAKSAWVNTGGEITEVVRSLLSLQSLRESQPWRAKKLKRPFHWIVSLYRSTGADLATPTATVWMIWNMGHVPYQWHAPNGFPDVAGAWASNLLPRWRQAALYGHGWYWSIDHDIADMRALIGPVPQGQWAQRVADILAGGDLPREEIEIVQNYIDTFASASDQAVGETFELIASSPGFQRY